MKRFFEIKKKPVRVIALCNLFECQKDSARLVQSQLTMELEHGI
jgi:hypothetical protein